MSSAIVDTNVAVVANHQADHVSLDCTEACIKFLRAVKEDRKILLDSDGEILQEYLGALTKSRPHQLGAQFLFFVLQNQGNGERVSQHTLTKDADDNFVDLPITKDLEGFDRSDRKFAALSKKAKIAVSNAVDTDWLQFLKQLTAAGVTVDFVCGCDSEAWFE